MKRLMYVVFLSFFLIPAVSGYRSVFGKAVYLEDDDTTTIDEINYYVLDDAEDGVPKRGYNGYVINVYDSLRRSKVTFLLTGSTSLFRQSSWDSDDVWWQLPAKGIGWALRTKNEFEVRVFLETDNGTRKIHYYCAATEYTGSDSDFYIRLPDTLRNGRWHEIIRDLDADLSLFESGNASQYFTLIMFNTKGNIAFDDLRVFPADTAGGKDVTPPEIHLLGSNNIEWEQGVPYVEQGAYCTDNVTDSATLAAALTIDASQVNTALPGMYRVKYDVTDEAGNAAYTVYRVVTVRGPEIEIGARQVYSTPAELGTVFVSPGGSGGGDGSSPDNAIAWREFLANGWKDVKPGDVVFFRGGRYYFTEDMPGLTLCEGKKDLPVIYESYPGEWAVFDGSQVDSLDSHHHSGNIIIFGNFVWFRNVEVYRLPHEANRVWGAHCILEGIRSHHNLLSGIEVSGGVNTVCNVIRDNYLYENSDLDIKGTGDVYDEYNLGNNADGLTLHSGAMNIVSHNTVYENSDDGLDTWSANLTVFSYNFVDHEGKASYKGHGDGGGIKLGSSNAYGTQAFHNIIYRCNMDIGTYVAAIKNNATNDAVLAYNTIHLSKYAIDYNHTTKIYRNILLRATHGLLKGPGNPMEAPADTVENSFNMMPAWLYPTYDEVITLAEYCTNAENQMLNVDDPDDTNFLHPNPDSLFAHIGAYASDDELTDIVPPSVYLYGEREMYIDVGALYIEPGAFAYDAKDGYLPVSINGHVKTDTDATFYITYTATDNAGNTVSFTRKVIVGDGGPVGVETRHLSPRHLSVFPNPASGYLYVKMPPVEGNVIIRVYNLSGGMAVKSWFVRNERSETVRMIDLSGLADGNYLITLEDRNGMIYRGKVVLLNR